MYAKKRGGGVDDRTRKLRNIIYRIVRRLRRPLGIGPRHLLVLHQGKALPKLQLQILRKLVSRTPTLSFIVLSSHLYFGSNVLCRFDFDVWAFDRDGGSIRFNGF